MKQQQMKLGKETGSIFNHLMSNNNSFPQVGRGLTILSWTDRHAYEVMEVSKDGKQAIIQQYNATRIDDNGMSDSQSYEYKTLCPQKETIVFRYGNWYKMQESIEYVKNILIDEELDKCCFDENGDLKLIKGVTKKVKIYNKIKVIFGVLNEYYDYSF